MANFKKKVVSSYKMYPQSNIFSVTLECGHRTAANGRKKAGELEKVCPDKVECAQCKSEYRP